MLYGTKKYTTTSEKNFANLGTEADGLIDKLILDEKSLIVKRLYKGLILAAKEDIKEEKTTGKESSINLDNFLDTLSKEHIGHEDKDIKEALLQGGLGISENYGKLKNHLKEHAMWGVDNSKSEMIYKGIKNIVANMAYSWILIINDTAKMAGRKEDLIESSVWNDRANEIELTGKLQWNHVSKNVIQIRANNAKKGNSR